MDTVVFDLGNVLIPWDPRFLYRKIFAGDEARIERFLREICTTEWNETHDAGRAFADGVAELVGRHPEHADAIRAYAERWDEMLGEPIAPNVALLGELKDAGRGIYALTNWPEEKFPEAQARCPFLERFDGIVVSGREGVRKPSPAIFRLLVSRYGVVPERSVFVDDVERNVEAARALGFQGIRYETSDQLRRDLAALGLP
jgi:2-haloacid dehalogenase